MPGFRAFHRFSMTYKKKISLKDIAKKAGVSTALVSYVLNGKEKESRVGIAMTEKIRKIAQDLKYKPNYVAKSLRSGKTLTIGLIIADIANPFFANIARVVEDQAKKSGYTVLIGSSDEKPENFKDLINVFVNRQVDGLIIVCTEKSSKQIRILQEKNYPFVLLDRYFPELDTDYVSIDSHQASFSATDHLLKNGFHKIGFIGYESELFHMQERKRGVISALEEAGIQPKEAWFKDIGFDKVETDMKNAMNEMLRAEDPVHAVVFGTYRLAINGLKYIRQLKIKIPQQLAIVSYGQAESFELYECPITYLEQPLGELGRKAVELLISKLHDPQRQSQRILMETKLKIGESSKLPHP
ncbi:LacI family DNA-binding transcriptional regulator [Negadavirga shengliensis]|uniref:LacI family DNA-binding transcriptional regulator n=1 Tax=Negadavirga shengliensis TaxID=1389218 RepID=A0ABV9T695_9BACT